MLKEGIAFNDKHLALYKGENNLDSLKSELVKRDLKIKCLEGLKKIWREVEVIGEVEVSSENGKSKGIQCLLYKGTSHYDVAEFNEFLQCVFAEMEGMDLVTPTQNELLRSLDEWNRLCKRTDGDAIYADVQGD